MSHLVAGLFSSSAQVREAVEDLEDKGYVDEISVVAKDTRGDVRSHVAKNEGNEVAEGALGGGLIGLLLGIVASITTVLLPGVGPLLVTGPLLTTWGITGAALGALTGGLVGALVEVGVPEDTASVYAQRIEAGDILVAVGTGHEDEAKVSDILEGNGAEEVVVVH